MYLTGFFLSLFCSVLYRAEQHRDMELRRNLAVEEVTIFIQKHLRIKLTQLLVERCKKQKPIYAAAIQSRSMEQVEAALASGCNVGFKTVEYHRCERMIHVFREEKRLEGVLAILVSQNPHECYAQFKEAVTSANDIEMKTPNAERARQLLAEAEAYRRQLDGEAAEQVQRLEEPAMKLVLEKADAVGYTTEHLEKIRTLLYDTAEDSFVKMQLKAAVKFNDRERVTRTTIRLKDLFFEKSGDMFKFHVRLSAANSGRAGCAWCRLHLSTQLRSLVFLFCFCLLHQKFGKLYPPQAWADLKFLSMDRDQLAAGQLKWTKNPIHNSLTQIPEEDKLTQKLAKEMFKNIMGCQWTHAESKGCEC